MEKQEVPNFRPDHYTSLPFKLDEVQETIAQNCFRATGDFKKAENYLHKARTGEWLSD